MTHQNPVCISHQLQLSILLCTEFIMSESDEERDRVPGFLYLDMDRVKSISARIDQGYIREQVEENEESEEVAASVYGSIKAQIFGSIGPSAEAGSEVSSGFSSASRSQEVKALHHYYYDLLEEWLSQSEGNWYHDVDSMSDEVGGESALPSRFRNQVNEGDVIRVPGIVNFLDFRTSMELMSGFFDGIDLIEEFQTEAIREQLTKESTEFDLSNVAELGFSEFKSIEPLFETFRAVLPEEYLEMLVAELAPLGHDSEFRFWATVQRDKLETNPVEMLSKHQTNYISNCTMLARVENITTSPTENQSAGEVAPADTGESDSTDDFEFGELLYAADDLGSEFGLKVEYPKVSVSPISIYR